MILRLQSIRPWHPALAKLCKVRLPSRPHRGIRVENKTIDLFKLSDETDLDMLNDAMTTFIESFQEELLPVSAELSARLVSTFSHFSPTTL